MKLVACLLLALLPAWGMCSTDAACRAGARQAFLDVERIARLGETAQREQVPRLYRDIYPTLQEYLAHLIAFSGDWEHGCELAERARQLNPNHPGWYWAVTFLDAYRKGDYRSARSFLLKGNQPRHFFTLALLAAVHGQLGERDAADKVLREVLTLKPDFPWTGRDEFRKWYLPELVEPLMDGLRKETVSILIRRLTSSAQTRAFKIYCSA